MRLRFLLLLPLAAVVVRAQAPSPYFPERGPAALHQRSLDLMMPLMVLSLALEPGYEDLNTLASLRLGAGARFVSVYATNGPATRSDLNGDPPSRVAARRREEAFRAVTRLGGDTHYLALPDYGVVTGPEELDPRWHADSLGRAVAGLLRAYRPDLVLLPPDFREEGTGSPRFLRLRGALVSAVESLGRPAEAGESRGGDPPLVIRCVEERANGSLPSPVDVDATHPIWKRSYRELASEARGEYQSLRRQIAGWNTGRHGTYAILGETGGGASRSIAEGLPVLGKRMKGLAASVGQSVGKAGKESGPRALATIAGSIRRIEQFFTERQLTLTGTERRVVATWRVGLDNLRCSVMKVEIVLDMPDSLMAEHQVLFMKCTGIRGAASRDSLKILFPAAKDGSWSINESSTTEFPLKVPSEFRILTPGSLDLDLPASINGIARPLARKKFPVIVVHEDRDWTRNYAYRKEYLFQAGPIRSAELITPVVRVISGERIVLSFQNFSRDAFRGEVTVRDSVVSGARATVTLPTRNYVSLDTLGIAWTDSVGDGDHIVEIKAGKKSVGRFLARKFTALADTTVAVGLITGLEDSPVAETLRRMRVPAVVLDRIPRTSGEFAGLQVIVMDRAALALRPDLPGRLQDIEAWVHAGGHLVILPQPDLRPSVPGSIGGIRFIPGGPRPATAPVTFEPDSRILESPNRIAPGDFDGWIIARTQGGFVLPEAGNAKVHLRDATTGKPVAASLAIGTGSITVTNLDLLPQLGIVHPGAFRILGNLLSTGRAPR